MNYYLSGKLRPLKGNTAPPTRTGIIRVMTAEEYERRYKVTSYHQVMRRNLTNIRYCKAERIGEHIMGTFSLPQKSAPNGKQLLFSFHLTPTQLIFVDNQNTVVTILERMKKLPMSDINSMSLFLLSFMEYLIRDDVIYLRHYEEKLEKLEARLLNGSFKNFDRIILRVRRELCTLGAYYEQLSDMGELLQQNTLDSPDSRSSRMFGLYSMRTDRLHSSVQMLKEYSMQLREMHQTQIDIHQNQIMKVLTVVTTIFMPLTLIAGWYGMNFVNMPELSSHYGYVVICIVSILIIIVEIILFKIKKWFD